MKCPKCKKEIESLDFDVTGSCRGQMYEDDVKEGKPIDYDLSCLTDDIFYDNFCCPECDEVIAETEEEAINLLKQ